MSMLVVKCAVRGYHVYQAVWEPHVGEGSGGEQKLVNDRYCTLEVLNFKRKSSISYNVLVWYT